jgi:hypothetical protein
MSDLLVGHGPVPGHSPYVPDFLVVQDDDGARHVMARGGRLLRYSAVWGSGIVGECAPEPFRPGFWPLMYLSVPDSGSPSETVRVDWRPLSEESVWRPKLAQELLIESGSMRGSPELVLNAVRAAASLVSIDIEKTVRDLRGEASPGESLVEAFERRGR